MSSQHSLRLALIATVASIGFFVVPVVARATLVLPQTPCDQQQTDFQIFGVNQHLSLTSVREDGTYAFQYGLNGDNNFASIQNGLITLRFHTSYINTPGKSSFIKMVGFFPNCSAVFGFGALAIDHTSPADHVLTYDPSIPRIVIDGEVNNPQPQGIPRYIWIEVWDGLSGSAAASYSYVVDVENLQNPAGVTTPPVSTKTPVLFVPGVLGTEMENGNELMWADISRMFSNIGDNFMDPLSFTLGLLPTEPNLNLKGVLRSKVFSIFKYDYTEGLIDQLLSQGYVENQDLFTLPYDWRYGVSQGNVDTLGQAILQIMSLTHSSKVDVVAHSTGGLIVKKYVVQHPTDHHIGKAVMLGVPNTGSPKAVKVLLEGDNFGVTGLSDAEMKKIAQNLPVVYDLAPSQKYFNDAGSFVRVISSNTFGTPISRNLTYSETRDFLLTDHGLNATAYNQAQALHTSSFDTFDMRSSGVDVYTVTGCKTATLANYVENRTVTSGTTPQTTGSNSQFSPSFTTGDRTVTYDSANTIPADDDKRFYAIKANHGTMPSLDGIRQKIVNILTGSNLQTTNIITRQDLTQNPSQCMLNGRVIRILSPINIDVIDEDNHRLGFAPDGSLQNDIPGADFEVSGDHKFVFLPEGDGETYAINLTGTGSGSFTLQDQEITDGVYGQTQVFANLPVTPSLKGILDTNSSQDLLKLDLNGDGIIDQALLPTGMITANQANDLIAPTTTAVITGLQGLPGNLRTNASITLSGVDPIIEGLEAETSGFLNTLYQLDGGVWQIYTSSISVLNEGSHVLNFYSVDRAGNHEDPKTSAFTIDKTMPEIKINYNLSIKMFAFEATDNLDPSPSINCITTQCVSIDRAGNTTKLVFQQVPILQTLTLKNIIYNQTTTVFPFNLLLPVVLQKGSILQSYNQTFFLKNQQIVSIEYNTKTNQSTIYSLDKLGGLKKETVTGLKILQLQTDKGLIKASIKD